MCKPCPFSLSTPSMRTQHQTKLSITLLVKVKGVWHAASNNLKMSKSRVQNPDLQDGINYWTSQPASLDGVLGGFGSGSLPRVDALGSRQFILDLLPELHSVPSTLKHLNAHHHPPTPAPHTRTRALDVGAGIGRVTSDVLLPLVSDVVLLEPVDPFIRTALERCQNSASLPSSHNDSGYAMGWEGMWDGRKSVSFFKGPLQAFDPERPQDGAEVLGRVGFLGGEGSGGGDGDGDDTMSGFDIVWCQWCLGHLDDDELVAFLGRSKKALRGPRSMIVVKENLCSQKVADEPRAVFDEQDSSLTRSDMAFKEIFARAGLKIVKERIQRGLPEGLYPVKMYALR
ncbi:AdoMet dependent proline di-methyltransferase-domain-containing protein [Phlebopus sp. FC_14]|nr:AdoMet dependent proline di-methyltransferase-domain-containing protein [Phlebopus sp. FC_14]